MKHFKQFLILALLAIIGTGQMWATDYSVTFQYSGTESITGSSYSTTYALHRWSATSTDGSTVIYAGAKASNANGDGAWGLRYASTRTGEMIGNINPSYDNSATWKNNVPSAVGAIPGKIKQIQVYFKTSTSASRGCYILVGTSQIYADAIDPTSTPTGVVKSSKLTSSSTSTAVSQSYNVSTTSYTYFGVVAGSSSYVGISKIVVTYEASGGSNNPTLSLNPTSWDFESVETTGSASKTFKLSGSNLTAGALTISVPNGYSVNPSSMNVSAGTLAETDFTVSKNTTTAGSYNGNFTVYGGGVAQASAASASLSMTVVAPAHNYTYTHDFTQISGLSNWGNSYSEHTVNYDFLPATPDGNNDDQVVFASASKQTATISNKPVTKGGDVELKLLNNTKYLSAVKFVCQQWSTNAQTITLHYSTDGGTTYSTFTPSITATNFVIENTSLPAKTNAVKISFSANNKQVGISSVSFDLVDKVTHNIGKSETGCTLSITNGTSAITSAEAGDEVHVAIASTETGYENATISVKDADNSDVAFANGKFTMPAMAVTVTGTATKKQYTVTLSATNGKIQVGGVDKESITVAHGETATLTAVANTDYAFDGWSKSAGANITFSDATTNPTTITVTGAGTVTATFRSTAKADPELSWSSNTATVVKGQTPYALPSLTNSHSLSISYESSNTSVAEIAANGAVTINGVGEATITASNEADDTYAASSKSYTLTVKGRVTWHVVKEDTDTKTTADYVKNDVPTKPTGITSCDASISLVGWTTAEYAKSDDAPATLYTGNVPAVTDNADYYAVWANASEDEWVETTLDNISSTDVVVIAGYDGEDYYGIKSNGTSASPKAIGITVEDGKITSEFDDENNNIKWNITGNATDGYSFYVNGGTADDRLYCTTAATSSNNTSWRVGNPASGVNRYTLEWSAAKSTMVTKDESTARYLCLYTGSTDWRSYLVGSVTTTNLTFFKYSAGNMSGYTTNCVAPVVVTAPTFDVAAGTYYTTMTVKISNYDNNYIYFYTTDGNIPAADSNLDPTGTSSTYDNNDGIAINESCTLKVIAYDIEGNYSDVTSAAYVIDIPLTLAQFMSQKPTSNVTVDLTGAVIWAQKSSASLIFIQKGDIAVALYKYNHGKTTWLYGKKISGIVTGKYNLYNAMPELSISDFMEADVVDAAAADYPEALVVTDENAEASMVVANAFRLIQMENVKFGKDANNNVIVTSAGENTYYYEDELSVLTETLPNLNTPCTVKGILYPWYTGTTSYGYNQFAPLSVDDISTGNPKADAILPTVSEPSGDVAQGKVVLVTPQEGMTSTLKIGDAAAQTITEATNVTIDEDKSIVVTASAYYYTDNSETYNYHVDPSLNEYSITCATELTGGSVSADKASATVGTKITLTATPLPNYHFVSWSVNSGAITVENNQFNMPEGNVSVSAEFAENNKYTIEFTANGATGDVPPVEAKHANTSFEVPGKGDLAKEGYKFAGWKVGNVVYHQGDEFTTPEEVPTEATTITFVAQWVEGSEFTWVAAEQGYSDKSTVTTATGNADPISIVFAKADGTTAPTYYTNGTAVRVYGGDNSGKGGTVTIATKSNTKLISRIEFTFDTNNNLTTEIGNLNEDKSIWSGLAQEVILTAEGGQARIKTITVTYLTGKVTTLSIANVEMKKTDDPKDLVVTCNVEPTPEIFYEIAEEDQQYATISEGKVTALKVTPSPITVTANIAQGSNYTAASTTFKITVTERIHPNLSFDEDAYEADLNTAFDAPTLNKPNDITVANISYSSSETSVADVDASTGAITINAEGETTITATFSGDVKYDPQTVTYVLTVIDHTKDVLTAGKINQSGYGDWSKSFTSTVVFKGNTQTATATGHENEIQMRAGDNSGIVTTSNIGYLKNLSATASSNTSGHYLEVYGKTTPYESVADLYDGNKCGIKIGTIAQTGGAMVWETGKAYTDKYWYIGIKSKTGAAYYSDITFVWEPAELVAYDVTYSAGDGAEGETVVRQDRPAGAYELEAKPADFEKDGKIFAGWKANGEGEILAVGSNYTLSADVEFVAYWSDTYTITYSAGEGAEGENVVIPNKPEGPYTLAEMPADFDKFGFTFAGWKANGEGETLAAGASYTVSGDVNFIAQWDALPAWVTTYTSNLTVGAEEYTITIKDKNYEGQRYGTGSAAGVATIALREGAQILHFHAAGWADENVTIQTTMGETNLGSFGTLVREPNVSGSGKTYTIATPNSEYFSIDLSSYTIEEGAEITFTATAGKRFVLFGVNQEGGNVPVLDHLAFTGEATSLHYEAGDVFDPAGLGVNAIYTIGEEEQDPVAVAAKQIEWSFAPAVLALETTSVEVTASHGGKSVSMTVENVEVVEPVPVITVSPKSVTFAALQDETISAQNITVTMKHVESVTVSVAGSNVDAFNVVDNIASEGKISVVPTSTSTVGHFTATITVKDNASDAKGTISLTLDIEEADDVRGSWRRVTNAASLEDGMKIVIASTTADIKTMGKDKGNNRYAISSGLSSNVLTPGEGACYFTLEALDGGKFAIKTTGGKYLYAAGNGSNNYLKEKAELDEYGKWTISIAADTADIQAQGDNVNKLMRYNSSNPGWFACYLNGTKQSSIAIYAKNVKITEDTEASTLDDYADVKVTGDAKLVVDEAKTLGNITGNVEVNAPLQAEGVHLGVENTMTINSTVNVPSFSISVKLGSTGQATNVNVDVNNGGNIAAPEGYVDMELADGANPDHWHSFTVPFEVDALNGIYDAETGAPLQNEVNYAIMVYDGEVRAQGKYGWKKYRGTLKPGTFYLITIDGNSKVLRFMKKEGSNYIAGNSMEMTYYGDGDEENMNNGWCGVGNQNMFDGYVHNFVAQVLNAAGSAYEPINANAAFSACIPFFIQVTATATLVMKDSPQSQGLAPRRMASKGVDRVNVTFGNENYTDRLYISASEDALNKYQIGKDLVKMTMTNTPNVPQIFGNAYGNKLCMVNAPMSNDQAVYDLTLYAPQAGEYTISAPAMENAELYLTYEGNIIWNLSMSAYPMELKKGNNEGYGLLLNAKAPLSPTGIDEVESQKSKVESIQKIILDEKVFILRGGKMYDVTGKAVK